MNPGQWLLPALCIGLALTQPDQGQAQQPVAKYQERTVEQWIADFKHRDAEMRMRAAEALGAISSGESLGGPHLGKFGLPGLTELLANDPEADVRAAAAFSLGSLGPLAESAVPALRVRLKDANARVRDGAFFALTRIGTAGVPPLLEALKDADPRQRQQAAFALGQMGTKAQSAVPALKAVQKDPNGFVRKAATEALQRIGS